ncbi:MAG: tRNA (5-methylaminomethyl-2-thiouridine)(34)-methyltransferase MnmD [Parabacteroides sp.]|nr:tRNA (5-methylaminomethyl-2-thiouridine)(34)-methyltransferase MnmD [Parabacteroides sp.]
MDKQDTEKMVTRRLEVTADGSHTLYLPGMDEHYHSVNGAVQESRHVFIEAGFKQIAEPAVRILEIGFGTGLNAFLTLLEAGASGRQVTYYSVERYPLDEKTVGSLNYGAVVCPDSAALFDALHRAPWDVPVAITPFFMLHKIEADSNMCVLPPDIDLVYFDAFAPDKQPEMWNPEFFYSLYRNTVPGGLLTTYCAKGTVRRMMQAAGYGVERLPGPPGKREMLRGKKSSLRSPRGRQPMAPTGV